MVNRFDEKLLALPAAKPPGADANNSIPIQPNHAADDRAKSTPTTAPIAMSRAA
jgi:hypothetical protein